MKKKALITITSIIVIVVLFLIFFMRTKNAPAPTTPPTPSPSVFPSGFIVPQKTDSKMTIKTNEGSVATNNVYADPIQQFPDNSVAFANNNYYYFAFFPLDESFVITILNPDIQTARVKAENDFLQQLSITKEQACDLKLTLAVPFSINQENSGQNFDLSFCPNGKPFN